MSHLQELKILTQGTMQGTLEELRLEHMTILPVT